MASASLSGTNSGLQVGINHGNIYSSPDIGPDFFHTSSYQEHKEINHSRVKDTCRWFLDHPTFQKWRTSNHDDLLWLSANPGCGKSVLSKALVNDRLVNEGSATICYFFFKDNEEQNNSAAAICALLHQLFSAQQNLFQRHAERQIRQHGKKLRADFSALWQLWMSVTFDSSEDVICIIDALDECRQPDRNRIIQVLERFYTTSQEGRQIRLNDSKLKFLVTSRPYTDIEWGFGELTNRYPAIRLSADDQWKKISDEITVVMETKVDEIVDRRHLGNDIQTALKSRFSEVRNTNYLWLYLTLDVLKSCLGLTKKKLLRRIDELPKNVEQAYEEILQRCEKEYEGDGRRLLEIIVAAPRPLTLFEIDIALEIQPSSSSFDDLDLEGPAKRKQWTHDACGLFVNVIDSRVHLIHQTAKEFLLRRVDQSAAIGRWGHSICLGAANLALSKISITYLRLKNFQRAYRQPHLDSTPQTCFLDYSANHWIYHTREAGLMEEDWVSKAADLCEVGCGSSSYWIGHHQYDVIWRMDMNQQFSSLFWASRWGLIQVMQLLFDRKGAHININDGVVQAAARNDQNGETVMKLLLDQEADVNITNEVVQSAAANQYCGYAVMKLLLDRKGADIKITGEVVQFAAANQYCGEAVMKLLLDRKGVDINITDEVVQAAVRNEQNGETVIKLLLDRRGVDVNITDEVVQSAAANQYCGYAVMKLLLDRRGVDVNITHEVVLAAAMNRQSGENIMKLLLDLRGADVNITDEVVKVAAKNLFNGEAIIKLLLERRGVDIKITDEVVQAAAGNWQSGEALLKLLFERRGADVNITNEIVKIAARNPFHGGALIKLLLDQRGVNINITDEVVLAAVINEQSGGTIMKLLLDRRGADFNITDEVVQAAAMNEQSGGTIMKLLLDRRGADVNITDEVVPTVAKNGQSGDIRIKLR